MLTVTSFCAFEPEATVAQLSALPLNHIALEGTLTLLLKEFTLSVNFIPVE